MRLFIFLCFVFTVLGEDKAVSHFNKVEKPVIGKPDYLKPVIDPVFKSKITRISGNPGEIIPGIDARWDKVARHNYPKDSAWNCDQSLIIIKRHDGFPAKIFLDGTNYKPLFGRNSVPGTECRWHPKKPDVMVFVKDNRLGYWNVRTDKVELIETFTEYSKFHIGPWEGNLSDDGDRIVLVGFKGQTRVAFAYDMKIKKKFPDMNLSAINRVDWASISPSGKYIILNGELQKGKLDQSQVYDLQGSKVGKLWAEYGRPSHYDLTIDENGDEVAVGVSKSKPDEGRIIKRRLKDGKVTVLTKGGYGGHTSTRNVKRPGWCYVTYQYYGPSWLPFWDEIVAVKLDGSMTVERLAHMHSVRTDYLNQAHAVPSPDGKRVIWASSWGDKSGRPIGTYVLEKQTK